MLEDPTDPSARSVLPKVPELYKSPALVELSEILYLSARVLTATVVAKVKVAAAPV